MARTRSHLVRENLFDGHREESREFERKRQRWIELARFDRVDGLPRDLETVRQLRLRPVAFCPEYSESILHPYRLIRNGVETPTKIQKRLKVHVGWKCGMCVNDSSIPHTDVTARTPPSPQSRA